MSAIFKVDVTGISQEEANKVLWEFHQRVIQEAQNRGKESTIAIRGLRFQKECDPEMSPTHLLRSTVFFSGDPSCQASVDMNLDLPIIAEVFREILVYHHALGGGWIKIISQEVFGKGEGLHFYESPPL